MNEALFRLLLQSIVDGISLLWGNSSINVTFLGNFRAHVSIEADNPELLRDYLNEIIESRLVSQISEYDRRCDTLFFIVKPEPMEELLWE